MNADAANGHSNLSDARESREVAEGARQDSWEKRSFMKELFGGRLSLELVHPPPRPGSRGGRPGRTLPREHPPLRRTARGRRRHRPRRVGSRLRASGTGRPGRLRNQDPARVRGPGAFADFLQPGAGAGGQPLRLHGGVPLGAPVDRGSHAARPLRHRGTEARVPSAGRARRAVRVRADRAGRRVRSSQHVHLRRAFGGRNALHPQRREAVDHQRPPLRPAGGDGAHRPARGASGGSARSAPSSSRRGGRGWRWARSAGSWDSTASRTACCTSTT